MGKSAQRKVKTQIILSKLAQFGYSAARLLAIVVGATVIAAIGLYLGVFIAILVVGLLA